MQDKDIMNDEELLLHEKAEQLTKELEKKQAAQDRLIAQIVPKKLTMILAIS